MRTLRKTITYEGRATTIRLYHLTDLHLGAAACDETLLRRYVAAIEADPLAYWIGGGDYIDAIARKGDKRYQESTMSKWLRGQDDVLGLQRDYVVDLLAPIAGKCLGLVNGNHEHAALRFYDRNIYWEIVTGLARAAERDPAELGLGIQGFIVLKFRRRYSQPDASGRDFGGTRTITIYTHHGYGGGRLPGGHALALGRILGDYECDLALLGHRHVTQMVTKTIVKPGVKTARTVDRYGLFCGTFLGAYVEPSSDGRPIDTYPEHMGLPPSLLGTPTITIKPDEARVSVALNQAVEVPQRAEVVAPLALAA